MSKKQFFLFLPILFSFSFVSFALGWLSAISFYPELKRLSSFTKNPFLLRSDSSGQTSSDQLSGKNSSEKMIQLGPKSAKEPLNSASQTDSSSHNEKEHFINSSLFKNMQDNVMMIFNPYEIDRLNKKNTLLDNKNSYIHKKKKEFELKKSEVEVKTNKELDSYFKKDTRKSPSKKDPPASNLNSSGLKQDLITSNQDQLVLKQKNPSTQNLTLNPFLQKVQKAYDKKNKEQLFPIENQQNFFKTSGKFSFLVNVFSKEEKAFEYIEKMKKEYPLWSFLLKSHGDHIRIYLGPFASKEEALKFKKELPIPYPFSSLEYLEEVGL